MSGAAAARESFLRRWLDAHPVSWLNRVIVLETCGSTQDEAFRAAGGKPGLMLSTIEQTAGRGRLGRKWVQERDLGLAVTIVLNAEAIDAESLSLRVGCAVCRACEESRAGVPQFLLKWPNDVVVPLPSAGPHAYRKLAGVLIQRRDHLLLVGIGINIAQRSGDWPDDLRDKATSLAELGIANRHAELCTRLVAALDAMLVAAVPDLGAEFRRRDAMTGSRQAFEHDGQSYEGIVENIDPWGGITLRTDKGIARLPIDTTTPAQRGT